MPWRGIVGALCCQYPEAHYEWKVENFFSLSTEGGDYYGSPDIQFSGSTFQLWLLPETLNRYVALILVLTTQRSTPIKIRSTLGIKRAAGDSEACASDTREFSKLYDSVSLVCMKRYELLERRQELAPGDALTFTVSLMIDVSRPDMGTTEVAVQTSIEDAGDQEANGGRQALENTVSGTTDVAVQTNAEESRGQEANGGSQALENTDFVTLVQNLKDLYVAGKDCDVTLEVKDKKFRAHRVILGARTPVLAAMFSHDTTEAETGIVRVEDCDPEAFEVFLGFVYSGTPEDLTEENVANVYYVADKYDLPGLKKGCVRHMLSNLTIGSVCSVIDLAERHAEELLQERATEFFVENAREIFRTASWRKFLARNTNLANDLIIRGYENLK